jgi:hypothetical protein
MQDDPLLEQLDWFFTSLHWTSAYPSTLVNPQGKPTSDHTPCVITIQTSIPGSKVFRFENFWVAHSGFLSAISASWAKPSHKGNSAANINAKFKRLRYDLKFWSKSISKLTICIENSNKALMEIDKIEDSRPLSGPEKNFRRILKAHLAKQLEYQNAYWKKGVLLDGQNLGMRTPSFSILWQPKDIEGIIFPLLFLIMGTLPLPILPKRRFSFSLSNRD